jgi:hypothetical protein
MDDSIRLSYVINDAELQRTHALRTITAQVDLLQDGLNALQNGDVHITEEFLERAIGALTAEAATLRSNRVDRSIRKSA